MGGAEAPFGIAGVFDDSHSFNFTVQERGHGPRMLTIRQTRVDKHTPPETFEIVTPYWKAEVFFERRWRGLLGKLTLDYSFVIPADAFELLQTYLGTRFAMDAVSVSKGEGPENINLVIPLPDHAELAARWRRLRWRLKAQRFLSNLVRRRDNE